MPSVMASDAVDEAESSTRLDHLIQQILTDELEQAGADSLQTWVDETLAARAGIDAEWYVIGLRQFDEALDFSRYAVALETYLDTHTVTGAASRQKYALALLACGRADSDYVRRVLNDSIGQQGIMSLTFGLHLLHHGLASDDYMESELINAMLVLQCADGGFALSGESSDSDVTAMVLQALAPHAQSHAAVGECVERALVRLSELQGEQGDYASYGVRNAESTAQVLMALVALEIDPTSDTRFIKNGNTLLDALEQYRCPTGGYSHKSNEAPSHMATVQVFCSLVALQRRMQGEGPFYVFDDIDRCPDGVISTQNEGRTPSYPWWAALGIATAALIGCVGVLAVKKTKGRRIAVYIAVVAVVLIVIVFTVKIQSPQDYYGDINTAGKAVGTVTLEIRCDTVLGKSGAMSVPMDGTILPEIDVTLYEGATVYDILILASKQHHILVDAGGVATSRYIVGIGQLYEFDFGDLSGWMYTVNGEFPQQGCGTYIPEDGDQIVFAYSCDLGDDLRAEKGDQP